MEKLSFTQPSRTMADKALANAKSIWNFQQKDQFCDVEFKIGKFKKSMRAHRNVLACSSDVFFRMFTGSLPETTVSIPNIDPCAFTEVLRYLYIDECKMDFRNVEQILDCAEKYNLKRLKKHCYTFLACNMVPDTIWQIFYLADIYFLHSGLRTKCFDFYESNSKKCLESSFISNLPEGLFRDIIEHTPVSCKEESIYEACLRWVAKKLSSERPRDRDMRKQLIRSEILYKIRFSCITNDYFGHNISKRKILSKDEIASIQRSMYDDGYSDELFISDIRRPKLHKLMRCGVRKDKSWKVGEWKDAIDICFREVLLLHGIVVFGTISGESNYKIDVSLMEPCGDEQRTISVLQGKELETKQRTALYDVLLKQPVEIKRNTKYTIELLMIGACTVSGCDYETEVSDGTFKVTFANSPDSYNGTNIKTGQIPGVIVSNVYDS
ncbi:BTB/POZ domain-containing protein 6-like [Mytilus californianus]|uniref:BTB/POZ domain-containing protein 6-like n=1 Tax=Mytilus californianus TaxID=6549 RepID=UPI00224526B7|nr:BTB/POZ domain-containing protein 6-like [Mytilus californianus]